MPFNEDPQSGMFDRTIESPEIEQAIAEMVENKEAYKAYAKARATVASVVEQYSLEDGERLRVGAYVIRGRARAGGGFSIPVWGKVTIGGIETLEA